MNSRYRGQNSAASFKSHLFWKRDENKAKGLRRIENLAQKYQFTYKGNINSLTKVIEKTLSLMLGKVT